MCRKSKMETMYDGEKRDNFPCYLSDKWYRCTMRPESVPEDPVEGLDVSVLQNVLLAPVLGIGDPRQIKELILSAESVA